jgi:hypothetical protein
MLMRRAVVGKTADGMVLASISTNELDFGQAVNDDRLLEMGREEILRRGLIKATDETVTYSVQEIE